MVNSKNQNDKIKIGIEIFLSVFVVFSVCANEIFFDANIEDTPLVNFTYKLSQAFSTFNVVDILGGVERLRLFPM